jgi:hypothetical protein
VPHYSCCNKWAAFWRPSGPARIATGGETGCLLSSDCKGSEDGKRYSSIDLKTLDIIEITHTIFIHFMHLKREPG